MCFFKGLSKKCKGMFRLVYTAYSLQDYTGSCNSRLSLVGGVVSIDFRLDAFGIRLAGIAVYFRTFVSKKFCI